MVLGGKFAFLAVVLLATYVFDRRRVLYSFYANHPDRLISVNTFKSYDILFRDRIRNCEDAILVEDRQLAIVACDEGRELWNTVMGIYEDGPVPNAEILAYDYSGRTSGEAALKAFRLVDFPPAVDFHTVGIALDHKTSTLFVVNHAKVHSRIEMFKLDYDKLTATYIRTLLHPAIHAPNAIAMINSNEFYVTNDHFITTRQSKLLALMETYLGPPVGSVLRVTLKDDDYDHMDVKLVARMSFPNGVEILNDTVVAVASSNRAAVYLFDVKDDGTFKQRSQIDVPFVPDNISLCGSKLLIAGHPNAPLQARHAATRHICNNPEKLAAASPMMKGFCRKTRNPSWVAEWSEVEGLRHLFVGTEYGHSSTAVRDDKRGLGIVTGLYDKGILVWRE